MRPFLRKAALGCALWQILAGCGGSDEGGGGGRTNAELSSPIRLSGQLLLPDGTPVPATWDTSFSAVITGSPGDCSGGTAESKLEIDSQGRYSVTLEGAPFVSRRPECRDVPLPSGNDTQLTLRVRARATTESCAAYCRGGREGMSEKTCQEGCDTPSGFIFAERSFPSTATEGDLTLTELGPQVDDTATSEPLPDLLMDRRRARDSVSITRERFNESSCAFQEGCLTGTGLRRLLRFEGTIWNLGAGDIFLGNPRTRPEDFSFHACHGHYHFKEATQYELIEADTGRRVVVGRKQGFCMEDTLPVARNADRAARYDCENQGLSSGWADVYAATLDCQWLDITDVQPGEYRVRILANPEGAFSESDYSNNSVEFDVTIPPETDSDA